MDSSGLLSMSLELNVARKCRICGMDIHDLTCAFPIFGDDHLDSKIQRYLQLNIQRDDLLPKCVCGSCYLKLESIDQFALMANRTDEAFRAWISRLRGLNCPEEAARSVNMALPLFRPHNHKQNRHHHQRPPQPAPPHAPAGSAMTDEQGNIALLPQSASAIHTAKGSSGTQGTAPPFLMSPGVVCYSDLKLGLLIKDQELLKLILKALKWAENDRRATFDVLIQRLKNSSFREVLSNHNLLNDSDLTQLLKSYIGQGVMNSFLPGSGTPAGQYVLNNNVPPPLVPLHPTTATTTTTTSLSEDVAGLKRITLSQPPGEASAPNAEAAPDLPIDEDNVTQMEVGVDPNLYLPYDDEDSSSTTKFESNRLVEDRQENTVTIKLLSTNVAGDLVENKRMIPAILNVRGTNRFQCSACPECFPTNGDLQQHIVGSHLSKGNRTVITEKGKSAIKIRVRKSRPAIVMVPKPAIVAPHAPPAPPSPAVVIVTSTEPANALPSSLQPLAAPLPSALPPLQPSHPPPSSPAPEISIVPLKIPASTTITMIPMPNKTDCPPAASTTKQTDSAAAAAKKQTSTVTPASPALPARKPLKEPPPKVELVRKSKRKPPASGKQEADPPAPERKKPKLKDKEEEPRAKPPPVPTIAKPPRRAITSFCALCRKRLTAHENIREHMEQEHSRYECAKCDRAFKSALNLARHLSQSHDESVAAAVPMKSVTTPRAPKVTPDDGRTNKCSFCGRIFKRSNHLKLHLNHHLKDSARQSVDSTGPGSGLRTRTSLSRAPEAKGNTSATKARKSEAITRKSVVNRKPIAALRK